MSQDDIAEPPPNTYNATNLKNLLDNVDPVGSFATSGSFKAPFLCPRITVDDFGDIGLPLHPFLATRLKERCEKAPFGRGPATLLDESVRRAWQLEPEKVTIGGEGWEETLSDVVQKAAYELGISNENVEKLGIKASLLKVLLYEKKGHFKPHKDTVKEEGMFGTLIIQLPSSFTGGSSIIEHKGDSKTFEAEADCDTSLRYTAFYADCMHQILPITDGWRLCLAYNLVVTKPNDTGVVPDPFGFQPTVKALQAEVATWRSTSTGQLGFPLDHEYAEDNFGFGSLKGRDAVVLSVLRNAMDTNGEHYNHEVTTVIQEEGSDDSSFIEVKEVVFNDEYGFLNGAVKVENDWDMLKIGKPYVHDIEHHDAGNEGGGETTWYMSASIFFRPKGMNAKKAASTTEEGRAD